MVYSTTKYEANLYYKFFLLIPGVSDNILYKYLA